MIPRIAFGVLLLFSPLSRAENEIGTANVVSQSSIDQQQAVVGAYYYPWYGLGPGPVENDWQNLLRQKLRPPQAPKLGFYRSNDPAVIAEHIKQSQLAGISFWAVSWWGPDSGTDQTFLKSILPHSDADKLRYAVLYESTGRLGKLDEPNYKSLVDDFTYLSQHYFDQPSYLRVNNRPVVFIYLSRVYFREQGLSELAEVRKRFPDLYIVGDDVFGTNYQSQWAKNFDAITAYDVYGQSTAEYKSTTKAIEYLAANYGDAKTAANSVGAAFIPTIAPGYNDRAVRSGHPGTARYLTDQPEGSLFRAMIRDVALPNLDDRCGRMMMVTSFNEWYEDSQIEPTSGKKGFTSVDTSDGGQHFTNGDRYADYGDLYLDILREEVK